MQTQTSSDCIDCLETQEAWLLDLLKTRFCRSSTVLLCADFVIFSLIID